MTKDDLPASEYKAGYEAGVSAEKSRWREKIKALRKYDTSKPNQVYEHGVNVGYDDALTDLLNKEKE